MRKIKLDPSQNNEKYDDLPMLLRDDADQLFDNNAMPVSYTHLTLPTIYSV